MKLSSACFLLIRMHLARTFSGRFTPPAMYSFFPPAARRVLASASCCASSALRSRRDEAANDLAFLDMNRS